MSKRKFVEGDYEQDLQNVTCKSTIYQEHTSLHCLQDFLQHKNITIDLSNVEKSDLDEILVNFFCSLRKGTELYKRNTYLAIRQGLNRYLKKLKGNQFDIVKDSISFPKSCEYFTCLMKKLKVEGKSETVHYSEICESDFRLIIDTLNIHIPQQLQWFVFIIVGLFFARRGCENYEKMKKEDFEMGKTENGKRMIKMKKDEFTKNHGANDTTKANGGIIVETGSKMCPYQAFTFYLSKLNPENPFLWQKCRQTFSSDDAYWFENRKIGVNYIKKFMTSISEFCGLSLIYTNHSLRVSACTILGERHSENDIKTISGHRSSSGLGIYKRIKDSKKEEMALDLCKAMGVADESQIKNAAEYNQCPSTECRSLINTSESFAIVTESSSATSAGYVFNNCNVTINNFTK